METVKPREAEGILTERILTGSLAKAIRQEQFDHATVMLIDGFDFVLHKPQIFYTYCEEMGKFGVKHSSENPFFMKPLVSRMCPDAENLGPSASNAFRSDTGLPCGYCAELAVRCFDDSPV
jgi:hypothetical protein